MKLNKDDFNWYGFDLVKAAKHLGNDVEYLGTFCIKGAYAPAAVFYSPNPDLSLGHKHYPFLFMRGKQVFVSGMTEEEFEEERYQTGAHCKNCDDVIYSVNRHDYRPCKCEKGQKQIFVDGGKDYFRFCYGTDSDSESVRIDFKTGQIEITTDARNAGDRRIDEKADQLDTGEDIS